eukprot:6182506-Pleurochrysis_carterae.AAC.2
MPASSLLSGAPLLSIPPHQRVTACALSLGARSPERAAPCWSRVLNARRQTSPPPSGASQRALQRSSSNLSVNSSSSCLREQRSSCATRTISATRRAGDPARFTPRGTRFLFSSPKYLCNRLVGSIQLLPAPHDFHHESPQPQPAPRMPPASSYPQVAYANALLGPVRH